MCELPRSLYLSLSHTFKWGRTGRKRKTLADQPIDFWCNTNFFAFNINKKNFSRLSSLLQPTQLTLLTYTFVLNARLTVLTFFLLSLHEKNSRRQHKKMQNSIRFVVGGSLSGGEKYHFFPGYEHAHYSDSVNSQRWQHSRYIFPLGKFACRAMTSCLFFSPTFDFSILFDFNLDISMDLVNIRLTAWVLSRLWANRRYIS